MQPQRIASPALSTQAVLRRSSSAWPKRDCGATPNSQAGAQAAILSDHELLLRIQADDPMAFAALYDRHCKQALGLARMICGSTERAEDAVQDAFLAAWRGRALYDPTRGTPKTWILTLTRCRSLDLIRRHNTGDGLRVSSDLLESVSSITNVEDDAGRRDEATRLRASLSELPEPQREVILLAYFGGMSHTEIEERLDVPLGTVKGRLRLGLRKLAAEIDPSTACERPAPLAVA